MLTSVGIIGLSWVVVEVILPFSLPFLASEQGKTWKDNSRLKLGVLRGYNLKVYKGTGEGF